MKKSAELINTCFQHAAAQNCTLNGARRKKAQKRMKIKHNNE